MNTKRTRWLAVPAASIALAVPGLAVAATTAHPAPARPAGFAVSGELNAVAATSATSAWAVGSAGGRTLIAHWNGKGWKRVASPSPKGGSTLLGVAAISAADAWAVGQSAKGRTLIAHWDGKAWRQVASPSGATAGMLTAVAASSAGDAWAVGYTTKAQTLTVHWNGKAWHRVSSPTAAGYATRLYGVAAVSPHLAWAVGYVSNWSDVVLRWNGSSWKQVPAGSPPATCGDGVFAVAATSASDAWAVGTRNVPCTSGQSYVQQWKDWAPGIASWLWVQTPSPDYIWLYGVAATSASNVWAVGWIAADHGSSTFILHGNGHTWTQVASPHPAAGSTLEGVAATSGSNAWAVGYTGCCGAPLKTLILRWNGTSWR